MYKYRNFYLYEIKTRDGIERVAFADRPDSMADAISKYFDAMPDSYKNKDILGIEFISAFCRVIGEKCE